MPENIPESVKWVLKFLNLRSTTGEPNINKLPESKRRLKRPPLPPKEIRNIDEHSEYVDDKGHCFRAKAFVLEYEGKKQSYPTLDDFKHFFIKEGIPPLKDEELLLENGKPI